MHRSGTSALTRTLNILGGKLPNTLLGAGRGNELGHWEPKLITELHDRMLAEAGSSWNDWHRLDLGQLSAERVSHFRNEISRLIAEEYGDAPLFLLKDPRICRFVPLYRELLSEHGIDVCAVIPIRNPLSVAASLSARDGLPATATQLNWLRHVLDAEASTRDMPRAIFAYEDFVADWRRVLDDITASLGIQWPTSVGEAGSDIDAFISREHQHHVASLAELDESTESADWVKKTYSALQSASTAQAQAELDLIRYDFERQSRIFAEAYKLERVAAQNRVRHLEHELKAAVARMGADAQRAEAELSAARDLHAAAQLTQSRLEATNAELRDRADRLQAEHAAAQGTIRERDAQLAELRDRLEQLRSELNSAQGALRAREGELTKVRDLFGRLKSDHEETLESLRAREAKLKELSSLADNLQSRHEAAQQTLQDREVVLANLRDHAIRMQAEHEAVQGRLREREGQAIELHRRNLRLLDALRSPGPGKSPVRKLFMTPLHHIETGDEAAGMTTWRMLGHDPQFALTWEDRGFLKPGHYEFSLHAPKADSELRLPVVYVDIGSGFSQSTCISLFFVQDGDWARARFTLPDGALALRFDPSTVPGEFTAGEALLRSLSAAEYYGHLALRAVYLKVRTPSDAIRAAGKAVQITRSGKLANITAALRTAATLIEAPAVPTYSAWVERFDTLTSEDLSILTSAGKALPSRPLISVLMPTFNTPDKLLRAAIGSVLEQTYDNWELCIADDASTSPRVRKTLAEMQALDPRIKVVFREKNGHISRASNSALELATGEWIALLDHDDILSRHALFCVAEAINSHPGAKLIYSDEDKIDENDRRSSPHFKCSYSPELLRSMNYFNHLTVHRTELIRAVGGWRPGFEGSQDYDLNLRIAERLTPAEIVHIPQILYHWRAVAGSTALAGSEKSYPYLAGQRALAAHLERTNQKAKVVEIPGLPFYRTQFDIVAPAPLVSLIIPTRDRVDLLEVAIGSIIEKTTYPSFEILIIDNNSTEPKTFTYFDQIIENKKVQSWLHNFGR